MAKKRQMRQKVQQKLQKAQGQDASGTPSADTGEMKEVASTRVQRKVAKSVRFVEKLQSTQVALSTRDKGVAKRTSRKGKKDESLRKLKAEALGEALGSLSASLGSALPAPAVTAAKPKALTAKSRQKLVLEETRQMTAVLAHPSFKSDPFNAIHEHLQLRLPLLEADGAQEKLPKNLQKVAEKEKKKGMSSQKVGKKKLGNMRNPK